MIEDTKIYQEITIIRDCTGGSNATTSLCMDEKGMFFRKMAAGLDGEKLSQQMQWIETYRNMIKCPEIIRKGKFDDIFYYDMSCKSHVVDLFEYAHSVPVDQTWVMILNVISELEKTLYVTQKKQANADIIQKYISEKVKKNLEIIKSYQMIHDLQKYDSVIINGNKHYNLPYYEMLFSDDYWEEVFLKDTYSIIHGDLTLENIICVRSIDGTDDYYLIDPNHGNIHESKTLDYAKLLQSVHGGYEFIKKTKDVLVHRNRITFSRFDSHVYKELHALFRKHMIQNLGYSLTRSVYLHEIVHWIRLLPYELQRDENRAAALYARMLELMDEYAKDYMRGK